MNLINTAATFFSGGGGACSGLKHAGLNVVYGCENDLYAGVVWKLNNPRAILETRSILDVSPAEIPDADLFWFSPPCPEFSIAKLGRTGGTDREDTSLAESMIRIIRGKQPKVICFENVRGYQQSASFALILHVLINLGYQVRWDVADFSTLIPQKRKRWILIARKDGGRVFQAGSLLKSQRRPTQGWFSWLETLDVIYYPSGYYGCTENKNLYSGKHRDLIGQGIYLIQKTGCCTKAKPTPTDVPCNTITASMGADGNYCYRPPFEIIDYSGRSYSTRYLALARLSGFYNDFEFSGHPGRNARIIGNAVPPIFADWLVRELKEG